MATTRSNRRMPVIKKLLLSAATLGTAASIAGLGTFATFSGTATANHTVGSGTLSLVLGATGASTNRLNVNASNIAAGDTIQRSFDLTSGGTLNMASVNLTTAATTSSKLDTDPTNGLQMVIDKCSAAWTESGTAPAYTYSCGGTTTSVLVSRAVIGSTIALSNLGVLTGGATDHLRLTLTLPSAADSTFEGLTSTISYTFSGVQRAATSG
jgi:spore coat-associated protein N